MRITPLVLAVVLGSAVISAQSPALRFEVESVKRNVSADRTVIQVPPAGTVTFINVSLRILIRNAYQLDNERYTLIAGPHADIVGTSPRTPPRFDVQGKPPANSKPPERRAMLRALLEDRFKLRVHRETRQMPAYVLTIIREGRLGPNLRPSKFDCNAYMAQRRNGGTAEEPVDAGGLSWCLAPIRTGVLRNAGSVTRLMQSLQAYVDRPIVDATGLSGNHEWVLSFASGPNASADLPHFMTALQEQLGLKLEPRTAQIEVLVVDSVEMPTPD